MKHAFAIVAMTASLISCTDTTLPGYERPLPGSPSAKQGVSSIPKGPQIEIAVLLPLSGNHYELGKALRDAAQLALNDQPNHRLKLSFYDTKAEPLEAAQQAEVAIAKGAKVIVGPIFGKTTASVAQIASRHAVPVIAFTNDKKVASRNVFILGFQPDQQIKRVGHYALKRDYTNFFTILPNSVYGNRVADQLRETVVNAGGSLIKTEFYSDDEESLSMAASSIGEAILMDAKTNPSANNRALLISDGGDKLAKIIENLQAAKLDKGTVQFLGSGQWDEPRTYSHSYLQGAWFASSNPETLQQFMVNFKEHYHYQPQRLATLAYDAISLLHSISTEYNESTNPFTIDHLTTKEGFKGIDGVFRLQKDGVAERGLSILEVTAEGFKEIDAAPTSF